MADIAFDGVTVTAEASGGDVVILRDVTATLTQHRVALIGGNGSGKSTMARLVNGLVSPSSGTVTVDGLDVASEGPAVRRRVGFVFTQPAAQLVMPTVAEDVALSLRRLVKDKDERQRRVMDVLATYGLAHLADTSVHALSGGQQQLLALAGVLATEPSIVVADEPTTLLDLRNSAIVADRLLSLEQQLVLVTHDLDLALRCERVLVVEGGRIAADGEPAEAVAWYRDSVTSA
ncbi:energy-coupling factor ABC transporter ATP-binding protein [Aeromicrobium fastidiosum]|uniref:energy-coupling factor ABC transporter ATP-binding protein n=1 Tax=Aeromicrobium fastidiosum TaxID=52699 RepID=UPI0020236CD7|nr:ABC transporter ATP-binding protein [Aeromicrobium fastidiosum]MCL8252288.1 energy-coupling factor ABC transporter ATP-binding protein [Aeromicrobium fastidiosum]